ncbi:LuxR C-terminal-related transcriptional regulator [Kitasatospora sp. NPDC088134]|uniref:LuxR C-terminal-related transcriptional regulator n=1 Tax=Kitasatospora sp. NPDC088134 TaxID=3364071 RepID=UPI0038180757
MLDDEMRTVGPAVEVVLGLRAGAGAEVERVLAAADGIRVLASCGGPGAAIGRARAAAERRPLLLLALDDLGPADAAALTGAGLRVLLLVREIGTVDLAEVVGTGSAGVLDADDLTPRSLIGAVREAAAGRVPLPAGLARRLLAPGGPPAARPLPRLTAREQEVLVLMVDGLSNKQIARRLAISDHGVKRLVGNILAKLDAPNRTCAVTRSLREGLYEHCLAGRVPRQHTAAAPVRAAG